MVRLARTALPMCLVFVFLSQGTAQAGANVAIAINSPPTPGAYVPNPAQALIGNTVDWTNNTAVPHSATGDGPLNFFDTGVFNTGQTGSDTFNPAGTFAYHCSVHPSMHGTLNVSMVVSPTSGTANVTVFTVRWADPSIPLGFNVDIQYRRNGGAWTNLLLNQTGTQVQVSRTAPAPGTYDLRARTQRTSNGAVSGYSPPVTVTVT
jgi:plastocyanin